MSQQTIFHVHQRPVLAICVVLAILAMLRLDCEAYPVTVTQPTTLVATDPPGTEATTIIHFVAVNKSRPIARPDRRPRPLKSNTVSIGILRPVPVPNEGRIFFDAIGNFISTSEWFPLEVNVPDTIGSMWSGMVGLFAQAEQVPRILYRMVNSVL